MWLTLQTNRAQNVTTNKSDAIRFSLYTSWYLGYVNIMYICQAPVFPVLEQATKLTHRNMVLGLTRKIILVLDIKPWLKYKFYLGFYIDVSSQSLKITLKWATGSGHYVVNVEWPIETWSHLIFVRAAEHGIRTYLNGCDMDANDSKSFVYVENRQRSVSYYEPFDLGETGRGNDGAAGATIDELCIWHEQLNSQQILQFYMKGGKGE